MGSICIAFSQWAIKLVGRKTHRGLYGELAGYNQTFDAAYAFIASAEQTRHSKPLSWLSSGHGMVTFNATTDAAGIQFCV